MNVGIEALNTYCGVARIAVPALFAGRGLDPARLDNLMMSEKSVALPFEDPVTHAVNAAKPIVDALDPAERDRIELVVTSSESGVDYSKSIASYVHEHLGLSRRCRVFEVKQACYAATGALQLACGYLAAGVSPGAKALVIATDVSLVDEGAAYTEPAMGTGSAALLLSDRPHVLALDLGASGSHSYETLDSARPTPTFDIADADRSLFAYLDCLTNSFRDYSDKVSGVDFATTFAGLAMHTPFAGIVRAAHRKLAREHRIPDIAEDFARRVAPALEYPSRVGNLCSGSVYLALASLIDHLRPTAPVRVGLYSYGSGCASEFYSGVVDAGSTAAVGRMRIGEQLAARCELTFDEYKNLVAENATCLVPVADKSIDPDRHAGVLDRVGARRTLLACTGVTGYHRKYDWITVGAA
ncbi:polyketide biosynthesis 3-hydroxy-3-methylglutaryl-CoA synthase-like enzyme PksG [Saccharothrix tamanrassetensis]|uniref:Polyketide biosynthesis 3-hydroxy-3-methylglutaryl-CoA synthase-like enzyme PksG n=1 Tax=Saccharothrix tamanrassetensis TaxID=1051531 RepID=A0A841C9Y0_9PSEU|nr:hydroxymethylglutaryl-CoA synthase family protein [Saccharothrix tamanrassetensis]MBB5953770.1 polyketide biosynthesis 3-hydroxy-3-methylglutaryl-CoA synthase-like enzyme PksG [Saccharothrix tamanrassetensis]